MRRGIFRSMVGVALLSAASLSAQDFQGLVGQLPNGAVSLPPQQFGGGVETSLIYVQDFTPVVGGAPYQANATGYIGAAGADVILWAPLRVPTGASVEQVCLEVFDNDAAESMAFFLVAGESGSAGNPTPAAVLLAQAQTGVAPVPGFTQICAAPIGTFTFPLSVRTFGNADATGTDATIHYYLLALAPATGAPGAVTFGHGVLSWRRAVSPAPATATFNDVPTGHPFFRFVEALNAAGITGGCGSGNFCPDNPLTRGEMAVFLSAALGLHFPN